MSPLCPLSFLYLLYLLYLLCVRYRAMLMIFYFTMDSFVTSSFYLLAWIIALWCYYIIVLILSVLSSRLILPVDFFKRSTKYDCTIFYTGICASTSWCSLLLVYNIINWNISQHFLLNNLIYFYILLVYALTRLRVLYRSFGVLGIYFIV